MNSPTNSAEEPFFEPLQLNFEPTDLLVEFCRLRLVRVGRLRLLAVSIFEDAFGSFEQLLLPKVDLSRMQLVLPRQLADRPVPLDCLDRYLRLERRIEDSTLPCHAGCS